MSFERALDVGAQILESDIHATRDGVPVLLHDPNVDRTTNGAGMVSDFTLAQLRELDAAHHFDDESETAFPHRNQGVRIPTLEEAFEAFPDARFNLEIKANPPKLVGRVIELVDAFSRHERTLLTAGENPIMGELREERKQRRAPFAIGASLADILAVINAALGKQSVPEDVMALQIPNDFGGRPLVTEDLIRFCHEHGVAVHVWTINETDEMRRLLDLGVDGLVTDHPERMAALLGRG